MKYQTHEKLFVRDVRESSEFAVTYIGPSEAVHGEHIVATEQHELVRVGDMYLFSVSLDGDDDVEDTPDEERSESPAPYYHGCKLGDVVYCGTNKDPAMIVGANPDMTEKYLVVDNGIGDPCYVAAHHIDIDTRFEIRTRDDDTNPYIVSDKLGRMNDNYQESLECALAAVKASDDFCEEAALRGVQV